MTDEQWPRAEDLRRQPPEQLALQAMFPEWRVVHTVSDREVRYVTVPGSSFFALHVRLSEPPLMAADLAHLADLLSHRQREIDAVRQWAARSDLRNIVPHLRKPVVPTILLAVPPQISSGIRGAQGT